MSQGSDSHHGEVELRVSLPGGIKVVVSAPQESASTAALLLGHISLFEVPASPRTDRSFELVSSAASSARASPGPARLETRDQVAQSFSSCPSRYFQSSAKLCGSFLSGRDRIERAWTCGQWAAAVRDSRVGSPNRTPPLDLRARYYAVLRAPGLEQPTIFRSSAGYWGCIKSLADSDSISQSFPSELEARVYLESAGALDFVFAP